LTNKRQSKFSETQKNKPSYVQTNVVFIQT